ncbi:DoxX family protein [Marivirga lumbricoides]|uniref:DoxX family protein n=1 Tax=Marivirga lumbricoides TaxID=1046115 RepID=A0A2T4DVF6_9BACT|nr:DoxX family protein [Marivirga lumbricoides]
MNILQETGRVLFALPMVIFGVFHFVNTRNLQNVVPSFIPGDTFWVYLTGAALIAAGISILIKKQVGIICNLLAIMLLTFVLLIHLPSFLNGNTDVLTSVLKDTSLAGGAFVLGRTFK